ncbi:hypothetical protein IEO21_03840 [Rhodonia placenta]|uniref:Uncharacterized protein n=1 Tax=Rhodonia placenta TaxID=104341 RepID=A0A8H7U3U0_9APHY|nr:hypothetical protein IEO21_03840 [Postia placenta]
MNATSTILYSTPPTTNILDAQQRHRLIRSARKLGAVLGSTPQLREPAPEPIPIALPLGPTTSSKSARRHARLFSPDPSRPGTPSSSLYTSSTNSSCASLAAPFPPTAQKAKSPRTPRACKELPRPLVLRLHAVPMPPSDPRLPAAPVTPMPTTPATPLSPSAPEARRRRMAKLTRTLGENVPLDLVFPSRQERERRQKDMRREECHEPQENERESRRRSASLDLGASHVWAAGGNGWTGEWNRRDIREVQQQLRALRVRDVILLKSHGVSPTLAVKLVR